MSEPLVSVVIPVYKVEKYLPACLDSVLAQTYQNLQVIVVNDGSPDGSSAIAESYAEKDSRLEVVSKRNGGLSSARNFGLKLARGEYLVFVDSDDALHPDFIRSLLQGLKEKGSDLAVCSLARFASDAELLQLNAQPTIAHWQTYSQADAIRQLYGGAQMQELTVACSKLYPRRIYEALTFPEGRLHEDVAVALEVLLHSERIAITNAPLYLYRRNDVSIMHTPSWRHIDGVDFYEQHFALLQSLGSPSAELALLAAFKAGLTCLAEYSADHNYRKDPRYRKLQQRVKALANRVQLNSLSKKDLATVLAVRINGALATRIYRTALQAKKY